MITVTEFVVGRFRSVLYTLAGAVGLLLLIACCNVANMLLVRGTVREKEITIRAALGASRWRIVRQLLVENLLLSLCGAAVGCVLAYGGIRALTALIPPYTIPWETEISLDGPVLLFSLGVAVVTSLLFGLAPALRSARRDLVDGLKDAGKGVGAGSRHGALRNTLVVAEIALSLVLLIGAGLLMRTFFSLIRVDLGFNPQNMLSARFSLPKGQYTTAAEKQRFFRELLSRVETLPGVSAAAASTGLPPFGGPRIEIALQGKTPTRQKSLAIYQLCSERFFDTIGYRFLYGRPFTQAEVDSARRLAVVNEAFVNKYLPNEDPLGKRFQVLRRTPDTEQKPDYEIIGVVADIRNSGLQEPPSPEVILPFTVTAAVNPGILIRTSTHPESLVNAVRREIWGVDRNAALASTETLESFLQKFSYARPRFSLVVLGVFAGVGILLVGLGVYSVMAYTVSRQPHEIGIRMALGAGRYDVVLRILRTGGILIAAGVITGLLASFAATRVIATQLWNVSPADPWTVIAAVVVVAMMGASACLVPARRATRVDPATALRHD